MGRIPDRHRCPDHDRTRAFSLAEFAAHLQAW
jgi:hypothetical protein